MAQNNSTLYFLSYNNYYNRVVKYKETLADYREYIKYGPLVANFNPADGVDTEHIMNTPYLANGPVADYLIVLDENGEIVSRWFIIDTKRLCGGQYRITLHRDLVVDFYEQIINAPAFVERAICNIGNNLIYNGENFLCNQIKKSETLLKDKSRCAWIVGYVANDLTDLEIDGDVIATTSTGKNPPILSEYSFEDWNKFKENGICTVSSISVRIDGIENAYGNAVRYSIGSENGYYVIGKAWDFEDTLNLYFNAVTKKRGEEKARELQQKLLDDIEVVGNQMYAQFAAGNGGIGVLKEIEVANAISESGVFVQDSNGNQFTPTVTPRGSSFFSIPVRSGNLYETIKVFLLSSNILRDDDQDGPDGTWEGISLSVTCEKYSVTIDERSDDVLSIKLLRDDIRSLKDAPYKMFCIPYDPSYHSRFQITATGATNITDDTPLQIAMAIAKKLTKGQFLYDLQLLPFCPIPSLLKTVGEVDVSDIITVDSEFNYHVSDASDLSKAILTPICKGSTGEGRVLSAVIWCDRSSFTSSITLPISVPSSAIEFKAEHETSFYRLNSPNYQGSFQFKATSNNGVDFFAVKCTYKPYRPYIHISPNFKGLYGSDFGDARGLVCGGDFSLPSITDAWESYQIQNKNFLNSFNRNIENMDTTHNIQREQAQIAGAVGSVAASISGASSGAMSAAMMSGGNPYAIAGGAIAGGVGAGASSAIGLQMDLKYSQMLHDEALSYSRDQFNLSLENIRAMPYSLNNVSAYDINNKLFPFLEYFSCSDEERNALINKIKYRSMTVGVISTIETFLQEDLSFVSAQIIRLDEIGDDYHIAAAIANEVHKGIYI